MGILSNWQVPRAPFFRAYPPRVNGTEIDINIRTVVDRKRRFVYFRIPKAANSTVMVNLLENELEGPSKNAKRVFDRVSSLKQKEVAELAERFFLFTVVRNPYTRITSAYLDKVVRGKRSAKVYKKLSLQASDTISFPQFCQYLQAGGVNDDPHWYRQVDLIPCGHQMLNFVGRVETLRDDLNYILKRIGSTTANGLTTWDHHRTGANSRLKELFTPECIEIVRFVYEQDFAAFGYPLEPDW
jgi:hypothetical protein